MMLLLAWTILSFMFVFINIDQIKMWSAEQDVGKIAIFFVLCLPAVVLSVIFVAIDSYLRK